MSSNTTTFPRKEESEILSPVSPLGPTTGNVKSGARFTIGVVVCPPVVVVVIVGGEEGEAKE